MYFHLNYLKGLERYVERALYCCQQIWELHAHEQTSSHYVARQLQQGRENDKVSTTEIPLDELDVEFQSIVLGKYSKVKGW